MGGVKEPACLAEPGQASGAPTFSALLNPRKYGPLTQVDLEQVRISFTHGEPFLPYEQLLAVQPAASCQLLPGPYQVDPCWEAGQGLGGREDRVLPPLVGQRRPSSGYACAGLPLLCCQRPGRRAGMAPLGTRAHGHATQLPPPLTLQRFMLDPDSPINFFYPKDFVVDLEGKSERGSGRECRESREGSGGAGVPRPRLPVGGPLDE